MMVTRSKEKYRDRSDISRVDFAEPLVTLRTLLVLVPMESLLVEALTSEAMSMTGA